MESDIVITDKKNELPWAVLDTVKEASLWLEISPSGVRQAIRREGIVWDTYKVFRVRKD